MGRPLPGPSPAPWLLPWLEGWRLLLLLVLATGVASVVLGPDRSWDTRNYHLYQPWALLTGRTGDLLAAGLQGFHNPAPDLPFALLVTGLNDWPRLVCFVMGVPAAIALWLVWRLARSVFAQHPEGAALAWLAMLGAAGGAVLRSQVGAAAGDVQTGALVLAALVAAVPGAGSGGGWRRAAVAGLACGAAIGLKLTNAPYAPALAVLLALQRGQRAERLLACALGGILGLLLAYGWWGAALWEGFGNPLFPYFQDRLVPGWDGAAIGRDARFLPAGLLDALARPFRWAVSGTPIVTEERMRDPRVAAGLLAALALAARPGRRLQAPLPLAGFFLVALALWSWLFGIYRYAFTLEALAPLLVLGAISGWRRAVPAGAALFAVAAVATIPVPSGRAVPAARYLDLAWPGLPADAVVIETEPPVAFAAFGLPRGVPMASAFGVAELEAPVFRERFAALIGTGRPLYLLAPALGQGWQRLPRWGLEPVPEGCRRLCTNWSPQGVGPLLCPARRQGEPAPPAPDWPTPTRLCEAAGPGLESGGRRGMGVVGEGWLAFGPDCGLARLRLARGEAEGLVTAPRGEAAGDVLTVVPPADGLVRITATASAIIAEAGCVARR